jgi:hypothetical protein
VYVDQRLARGATKRAGLILTTAILFLLVLWPTLGEAFYDIPSDRVITWANKTGLDLIGGIPSAGWTQVTCAGAHADGTDTTGPINSCISGASANTVVILPAGIYYVASAIRMKSNVALRGAGAPYPWLPSGTGGTVLEMHGGSIQFDGRGTQGSDIAISSGYTKDSNTLVFASSPGLAVGNHVSIFQNNDPALVHSNGCGWCGDDSGNNLIQQYARVTGVIGNTITIDPPMYLTYQASLSPRIRKVRTTGDFGVAVSGVEDLKINNATSSGPIIYMRYSRNSWVKNVETYNAGSAAKQGHVQIEFSFANEIRDSHFHHGRSHNSDRNYGIYGVFWNSGHKIENNIVYSTRHAIIFEGGGSGGAILYNFCDANYEGENPSYLAGDLNPNHGPHPHMNLVEGNISDKIEHDSTMGSSSHNTMFRNWARGYRSTPFSSGRNGIFTQNQNTYMNFWGNVVGMPAWTTGAYLANSSRYPGEPVAFVFGYDDSYVYLDTLPYSTALLHGNYDYITDGVASWLSADHALRNSLYYSSKPSWYGGCTWPPVDPVGPVTADIPAKLRYQGSSCSGTGTAPPNPPTTLHLE